MASVAGSQRAAAAAVVARNRKGAESLDEGLSRNVDGASSSRSTRGGPGQAEGEPRSAYRPSVSFQSPNPLTVSRGKTSTLMATPGAIDRASPGREGSADEETAILKANRHEGRVYDGTQSAERGDLDDLDGLQAYTDSSKDGEPSARKPSSSHAKLGNVRRRRDQGSLATASAEGTEEGQSRSWLSNFAEKYGSVELDNKGSVARDHLALERTFLAWLRTSLAFASIGIAITQLFRLNTTFGSDGDRKKDKTSEHLKHVGRPLGATFLGIAIIMLFIGFRRYFESQHYIIRGKFPASRGSIVLVTFIAGALIVTSLVVVLAIARGQFD